MEDLLADIRLGAKSLFTVDLEAMFKPMRRINVNSSPYVREGRRGKLAEARGDYREAADLYLKASRAAPEPWSHHRLEYFARYTSLLAPACREEQEMNFDAETTKQDLVDLQSFVGSEEEPASFRSRAASTLARLYWSEYQNCDLAKKYGYAGRAIAICDSAGAFEKERTTTLGGLDIAKMARIEFVLEVTRLNAAFVLEIAQQS